MLRNTWKANKNDPTFVQAEIQCAHVERALHGRSGGFYWASLCVCRFLLPFLLLCVCVSFDIIFFFGLLPQAFISKVRSWTCVFDFMAFIRCYAQVKMNMARERKNTLTHTQIHRQMCGAEGKKATRIRNRITTRNMKHEHMRCSVCLFFFLSLRPLFLFPFRIRNDFVNQLKEKATVRKCT